MSERIKVSGPVYGGHSNGTYTAPSNVQIGSKHFLATLDSGPDKILFHEIATENTSQSLGGPVVASTTPTDGNTHANPAMIEADGTIYVFNTGHNQDFLTMARSTNGGKSWQTRDIANDVRSDGSSFTYANVTQHDKEPGDPLILFTRLRADGEWGFHVSESTDGGNSWSDAELLFTGRRPYIVTATHEGEVTHIFTNRGHPDQFNGGKNQGVYYAQYRDGRLFDADGKPIRMPADPDRDLDVVSPATGNEWVMDAAVMDDGRPVVTWVRYPKNISKNAPEKEAWWGRLEKDGTWTTHKIDDFRDGHSYGNAGVALDRNNPEVVYLGKIPDGTSIPKSIPQHKTQAFRYDLEKDGFDNGTQLTGFQYGLTGIQAVESAPGPMFLALQPVGPDGRPSIDPSSNFWDGDYRGATVVVPGDRFTKDVPLGTKTYTLADYPKPVDLNPPPAKPRVLDPEPDVPVTEDRPAPKPPAQEPPREQPPREQPPREQPPASGPDGGADGASVIPGRDAEFNSDAWFVPRSWDVNGRTSVTETEADRDGLRFEFDVPQNNDELVLTFDMAATSSAPGKLWVTAIATGGGYQSLLASEVDPLSGTATLKIDDVPDGLSTISVEFERVKNRDGDLTISNFDIVDAGGTAGSGGSSGSSTGTDGTARGAIADNDPAVPDDRGALGAQNGNSVIPADIWSFEDGDWTIPSTWSVGSDSVATETAESKDALRLDIPMPDQTDDLYLTFDTEASSSNPGLLWVLIEADGGGYARALETGIDPDAGTVALSLQDIPDDLAEIHVSIRRTLQRDGEVTISDVDLTDGLPDMVGSFDLIL